VIAYRAMLDVPRELVRYLARLLAAERRVLRTRRGSRALTCFYQALLVLIWFRKAEDTALLDAGFGISRATAYRYVAEGIAVLAAQRPDLAEALRRAADEGWAYVILDGKLYDCDLVAESVTSVKGKAIDAWYSGKHRDFGANIQAVIRPDGLPIWTSHASPIWTSHASPGHLHDLTCAQQQGVTAALNWTAVELELPALADADELSGLGRPVGEVPGRDRLSDGGYARHPGGDIFRPGWSIGTSQELRSSGGHPRCAIGVPNTMETSRTDPPCNGGSAGSSEAHHGQGYLKVALTGKGSHLMRRFMRFSRARSASP
jgi:hypothetical protein